MNGDFSVRLRDDGLWCLSYHGREQFTYSTQSVFRSYGGVMNILDMNFSEIEARFHATFNVRLRDDGLWCLSYHGREQFTFPTESEALAALELAVWGSHE